MQAGSMSLAIIKCEAGIRGEGGGGPTTTMNRAGQQLTDSVYVGTISNILYFLALLLDALWESAMS